MSERTAWLNGRLVPWSEASVPLDDRGLEFSESLYEVVPVCAGRTRLVSQHAARMRCGAAALGLAAGVPRDDEWDSFTAALLPAGGAAEGILYAQLTGGSADRRHLPRPRPAPTFFAYFQEYRFPREPEVAEGIAAITTTDLRWSRCDLKTTMLLPAVLAKAEAAARGAQEAVLVGGDGLVHEGASSNVFARFGNALVTPELGHDLLAGTIRPLVLRLAEQAGLAVVARALPATELLTAGEVFVTSTTFLVMPLVTLDGRPVAGGRPGSTTLDLARRVRSELGLEA